MVTGSPEEECAAPHSPPDRMAGLAPHGSMDAAEIVEKRPEHK